MLSIKTDSKLKKEAQKIAKEMGLSMSVLVNQGLRKLVETRSVTFQAPLIPNAKTGRALKKAMADIKAGKNLYGPFKSGKEMVASLRH